MTSTNPTARDSSGWWVIEGRDNRTEDMLRLTDAEFHGYAIACVDHLDPEQQRNRDYMIDVVLRRADSAVIEVRHSVQERAFAWLAEVAA